MATEKPERWQRINQILVEAIELETGDRASFLDDACGDDQELCQEIESLLKHHDEARADGFLGDVASVSGTSLRQTTPHTPQGKGLHIRCPHCHNPIEVVVDAPLQDITCTICGSHFSLVGDEKETRAAPSLTTVGHFELIERLGVGGFGTVWKARDSELDRTVAVKIPRKGQLTPEEAEKFLREARAAAQLRHPNIVSVHEVGRTDDTIYIVSDLVRGVPLSEWLEGQCLTGREAAELCQRIAQALHHAHEAGIVHRDLKPANIMIDADGEPHIMDFGLAKRETGEITMTVDGQVMGTPAYMAPEQAKGEAHASDRRADIYSLGVILFELLTGELPFRGTARMVLYQVINDDAPSLRKLNGTVPRDLETICLKCLEKEMSRRYESARDICDELRRYLRGEPIRSRPITRLTRLSRWCKRNPMIAMLTTTVMLLLITVAIGSALSALRIAEARSQEERSRRNAESRLVDMYTTLGLAASDLGKPYESALWFANAACECNDDTTSCKANRLRAEAWMCELPLPVRALPHPDENIAELIFHPRARSLIVVTDEGCRLWDIHREAQLPLPKKGRDFVAADWHPNGKALALVSVDGSVVICSYPEGAVAQQVEGLEQVTSLEYSPNGQYLAIGGKSLWIWNCDQDQLIGEPVDHDSVIMHISFDRDSRQMVTVTSDNLARVFAIGQNGSPKLMTRPLRHMWRVEPCLLDGTLVVLDSDHTLAWYDMASGELIRRTRPTDLTGVINNIVVSPDGSILAVSGFSQCVMIDSAQGEQVSDSVIQHKNTIYGMAFSPDGRTFLTASGDSRARLWSLADSSRPTQQADMVHQHDVTHASFAPTGHLFATAQTGGLVRIWRVSDSEYTPPDPGSRGPYFEFSISPDDRFVLPVNGQSQYLPGTQVFAIASGSPVGPVFSLNEAPISATFVPDREMVVTSYSQRLDRTETNAEATGGSVQMWYFKTGERHGPPLATPSFPAAVAYVDRIDKAVVACLNGELLVIDIDKNEICQRADCGQLDRLQPYIGLVPSPDGKQMAVHGFGNCVKVWDTEGWHLALGPMQHDNGCIDASFSPDGRWLVTASLDHTAKVWNCKTGQQVGPTLMHPDWVFSAVFSGDCRHILTACRDRQARLWEWQSNNTPSVAFVHDDEVFEALFVPGTPWVVTTQKDGFLYLWDSRNGKPLTPPQEVAFFPRRLHVTKDATYAIVSGYSWRLCAVPLRNLKHPRLGKLTESDIRSLAEIASGRRVLSSGGVVNLNADEWISKWRQFRAAHPDQRQLPLFREDTNQVAVAEVRHLDTRGIWCCPAVTLRVLGEDLGEELSGVHVLAAPEYPTLAHPGVRPDDKAIVRNGVSPLRLQPRDAVSVPAENMRTYWVRAAGHAWKRISIDHSLGGEFRIVLAPGGDVKVDVISMDAGLDAQLRLRNANDPASQPTLDVRVERDGCTNIEGLPAGRYVARLEIGKYWDDPLVLASAELDIRAGTTAQVRLAAKKVNTPPLVPVSGTLVVPAAWNRADVAVVFKATGETEKWSDGWKLVPFRDMAPVVGDEDTYSWSLGEILAGTYQVDVEEVHSTVTVGEGGDSSIRLVLPPPAEVRVRVVDEVTGLDIPIARLTWHGVWPDGVSGGSVESVSRNTSAGDFRFRAAIGKIVVSATHKDYEWVSDTFEVAAGVNEFVLHLSRACGVDIVLKEGDKALSRNEDWHVDVEMLEGDEGQRCWSGARISVAKPGRYRVKLGRIDGFEPIPEQIVTVEPEKFTVVVFQLKRS